MKVWHFTFILLFGAQMWGQQRRQVVVLDFSMSMAGFAAPTEQRMPGVLERLGEILLARGTVQFYSMLQIGSRPAPLGPLAMQEAGQRFGATASFRGTGTPLLWSIDQAFTNCRADDLILVTDGMEDNGPIEKVAVALSGLAENRVAVGIVAIMLPFVGPYYTEQTIPIDQFLPDVEKSVSARSASWRVARSKAPCGRARCYDFEGERPLLFLLFSRSGSLPQMVADIETSLAEMRIAPTGVLQLAPMIKSRPNVKVEASKLIRARIKVPDDLETGLMCAETIAEPQSMNFRITFGSGSPLPQPSTVRVTSFELLEKPNWVVSPPNILSRQNDSTAQAFQVVCPKGKMSEPVTELGGKLRVRYHFTVEIKPQGWWTEMSASNTWQFPFKVYKLDEIVRVVHGKAMAQEKLAPTEISLRMKVQN